LTVGASNQLHPIAVLTAGALRLFVLATGLALMPQPAAAVPLDGAALSWPCGLPFIGILLSIAAGPLLFPKFWHRHYGKIAAAWSAVTLAAIALAVNPATALDAFVDAMLDDYLSFIVVLFALFTVAGGIIVTGPLRGAPLVNLALLALGTAMASAVGTTGAAMILIRPLIRANEERRYNAHVFVFFIFLVANIGGALTPLGDPPLFVGFLRGINFFWTTRHLLIETLVVAGLVLTIFFVLDAWLYAREDRAIAAPDAKPREPVRIRGGINFLLIAAIIAVILIAAAWRPGISVNLRGTEIALQNLLRDASLVLIAVMSIVLTPDEHRAANGFSFEPIKEVAKLFAGIFLCIMPVLAILQAGKAGAFAWLIGMVTDPAGRPNEAAYFWLTGGLSAVLDNAPTYLVFFQLAGGDPHELMGALSGTLAAISMGAVYMGALTYIGNAPNLMIYAIVSERGIRMPSFFGFIGWSLICLVPVLALVATITSHF